MFVNHKTHELGFKTLAVTCGNQPKKSNPMSQPLMNHHWLVFRSCLCPKVPKTNGKIKESKHKKPTLCSNHSWNSIDLFSCFWLHSKCQILFSLGFKSAFWGHIVALQFSLVNITQMFFVGSLIVWAPAQKVTQNHRKKRNAAKIWNRISKQVSNGLGGLFSKKNHSNICGVQQYFWKKMTFLP